MNEANSATTADNLCRRIMEDLRLQLIDRTRRNRLLHFRHSRRSALIRVVDEAPERILGHLLDGRSFVFAPLPDPEAEPADERSQKFQAALIDARATEKEYLDAIAALDPNDAAFAGKQLRAERELHDRLRERLRMPPRPKRADVDPAAWARQHGVNPSWDVPAPSLQAMPTHSDGKLQTLLYPEQLRSRLTQLDRRARSVEQETGATTLYLALGFLEWFESPDSDESLVSPLLLLPVRLERQRIRGGAEKVELSAQGTKPEVNLSLQLRLREMRLTLPDFELDAANPAETYLAAVAKLAESQARWRVRRYVTLATFSFARIAMYRDLDRANWIALGEPALQPLVRPILQSSGAPPVNDVAEVYCTDDEAVARLVPMLPLDADSSQISAIADAMHGRTMVIQGPPGTGKSQTIANLIANMIYRGKTILFLSEKMAALDVVKSRLDHVGLGPFCLTLHATGAKPATVMENLQKRARLARLGEREIVDRTRRHRDAIDSHLKVMHRTVGPAGETVHALIGRLSELTREMPHLPRMLRPQSGKVPDTLSPDAVATAREALEALESVAASPEAPASGYQASRFAILDRTDLFPDEEEGLLDGLAHAMEACEGLERATANLAASTGAAAPATLAAIERCAGVGRMVPDPSPEVSPELLPKVATSGGRRALATLVEATAICREAERRLRAAGVDEPASVREGRLGELAVSLEALGLADATVEIVEEEARAAASDVENLDRCASTLADLCAALDLPADPDLGMLGCAAWAAELAAEVGALWASHRRPGLAQHCAKLQEILTRAENLAARRQRVGEFLVLEGCSQTEFRGAASALLGGSWLGFLSRDTRRAQRFIRAHWRGGPRPNARVLAGHLVAAAFVLEELEDFRSDQSVVSFFGSTTEPEDPIFRHMFLAASWQLRVESRAPEQVAASAMARRLIASTPDALEKIASFRVSAKELYDGVRAIEPQADIQKTWGALRRSRAERAAALAVLAIDLAGIGIHRTWRLSLRDLQQALTDWHSARAAIADAASALGLDPPWAPEAELRATLDFVDGVVGTSPELAPAMLALGWADCAPSVRRAAADTVGEVAAVKEAAEKLSSFGLDGFVRGIADRPLADVSADIRGFLAERNLLPGYLRFATTRAQCLSDSLARAVVVAHEEAGRPLANLPQALDWLVAWTMVRRQADNERDIFARTGEQLDGLRRAYADFDRAQKQQCAEAVRASALGRAVPLGNAYGSKREWTDGALLRHEFTKVRRHIAVRDLMGRASGAVQALTPCLMMSPLTVAQYLPAGRVHFDVVIMDEASQIRPAHALGALLRTSQAVIVGDPKQLPPSDFFERGLDEEDDDEEAVGSGDDMPLPAEDRVVTESVLDAALGAFQPMRRLLWHYRSRHESLIAFSNREFYDDHLIVSPSPDKPCNTLGIELVLVAGTRQNRCNITEADAVMEMVALVTRNYENLSLGVVTMNIPQRDLIQDKLDALASRDPEVESYLLKWHEGAEPLFVKNLENAQGDERDIIVVSLGWAPTPQGVFYQRFSPLSRKDGDRRLNVLFTRAKRKILLLTSFEPERIHLEDKTPRGIRVLRDYMVYARDGVLPLRGGSEGAAESPFEESVAKALRARGHDIALQVGVSGYRVDLAVRDPRDPSCCLLGIECDGAAYHSARSARDRDRLRQEVLEGLGWKLVRVWSTDWFRDPRGQTDRLEREIRQLISKARPRTQLPVRLMPMHLHKADLRSTSGGATSPVAPPGPSRQPFAAGGSAAPRPDLGAALRDFRDNVILRDLPGSEPERCILRDEMIRMIIARHLDDPDDWFDKVPEWMRSRTDGRQKNRYLESICDLVAGFPRPPAN